MPGASIGYQHLLSLKVTTSQTDHEQGLWSFTGGFGRHGSQWVNFLIKQGLVEKIVYSLLRKLSVVELTFYFIVSILLTTVRIASDDFYERNPQILSSEWKMQMYYPMTLPLAPTGDNTW